MTDTPAICQRDTGQRSRCAMVTPRHEGTPYLIEVTPRPGKYELLRTTFRSDSIFENNHYGASRSEARCFVERRKEEKSERTCFFDKGTALPIAGVEVTIPGGGI